MPRSITEFITLTDNDFIWRRQELTTLKLLIQSSTHQNQTDILCRAATCLLYSHWEGYIKKSSDLYIDLIEKQGFDISNLQPVFRAINLYGTLKSCAQSNKITMYNTAISSAVRSENQKFRIGSFKFEIEGNLNYERLYEILIVTGYSKREYELNKVFIDEIFLQNRNLIAHGERITIKREDYIALHDRIVTLLLEFKTFIQNSAATEAYKS